MLETSLETVCFIIVKARALSVAEGVTEADPASNPADEHPVPDTQVLADQPGNLTERELSSFIDNLNDDQKAELVALARLGRGEEAAESWAEAVEAARVDQTTPVSRYLLGMPLLADFLEEGINRLGFTCEDVALDHL